MPRRFNFTKRKRIRRKDIRIRICQSTSGELSFDADLDLSSYGFESLEVPPVVYVEARRSATSTWKRFPFGTTEKISPPPDRSLAEFGVPNGVLFSVRVTSISSEQPGVLLAEADGVRPLMPGETELPAQPLIEHIPAKDLGSELWRLDFSGEMPLLKINDSVPMGPDQFLTDATFRALFAPAVMRQVLTRIIVIEQAGVDEDGDSDWQQRWLRFGSKLAGSNAPKYSTSDDLVDVEDWVDAAVEAFAERAGLLRTFESDA